MTQPATNDPNATYPKPPNDETFLGKERGHYIHRVDCPRCEQVYALKVPTDFLKSFRCVTPGCDQRFEQMQAAYGKPPKLVRFLSFERRKEGR